MCATSRVTEPERASVFSPVDVEGCMAECATTPSGVFNLERKILLVSGSVLFLVFLVCCFVRINKPLHTNTRLPESIEEYRESARLRHTSSTSLAR
jgi:hypothetical protein